MSEAQLVSQPESEKNTVLVRILKPVGTFQAGKDYEVNKDLASQLCASRERHNGTELIRWQNAILVSDLEVLAQIPPDLGGLSVDEAKKMGVKNIAVDPKGPGSIEPSYMKKSDDPSFSTDKGDTEGESAKAALALNAKNPASKKKGGK